MLRVQVNADEITLKSLERRSSVLVNGAIKRQIKWDGARALYGSEKKGGRRRKIQAKALASSLPYIISSYIIGEKKKKKE